MYLSNRHKEVEDEFKKLPDASRNPQVYIAMCKSAKIRNGAIENRLSALELFSKSIFGPKKTEKANGKKVTETKSKKDESEEHPDTPEGREAAAAERIEKTRRAWEAEYEDVETREEKDKE